MFKKCDGSLQGFAMHKMMSLIVVLLLSCLSACSTPEGVLRFSSLNQGPFRVEYDWALHQTSVHAFDPINIESVVSLEQRAPKLESLFVVLDAAALKGKHYRNIPADVYGREVLRRFHRTLPVGHWNGGLFVTTLDKASSGNVATNFRRYDPKNFEASLEEGLAMSPLEGRSLGDALDQLAEVSRNSQGRIGVFVITSWERIDEVAENSMARFHQRHESKEGMHVNSAGGIPWASRGQSGVCLYGIGVGNRHSREKLSMPESCAAFWAADAVMQPSEMAAFALSALYGNPADDDSDGIPNYLDKCPDTPRDRIVTSQGCLRFPLGNQIDSSISHNAQSDHPK